MTVRGLLVEEFDLWVANYPAASIEAFKVGTTTPANLFLDEAMTIPAGNPQILQGFTDSDGISYGKFAASVYAQQPYFLEINGTQQTGARRLSLSDLVGVDASQALVTSTGSPRPRKLADHLGDAINVADFGTFLPTSNNQASPATNNATIVAAIGAAASAGGGDVICPAGSYEVTGFSIPGSVIVRGRGKGVTTLVCKTAAACFTLTGNKAGFANITLDGVNLVANSIGLTSNALTYVTLSSVEVRRFAIGILHRGGTFHRYKDLWLSNCNQNIRLLGDLNTGQGNTGGPFEWLDWDGGQSIQATTSAVEISQFDQLAQHCRLRNVSISGNVTTTAAMYLAGVQFIDLEDCTFATNDSGPHIWLRDGVNTTLPGFQCAAITIRGGQITGSSTTQETVLFDGLARNVLLDSVDLAYVTLQMNDPTGAIILRDCIETGTQVAGDTSKLEHQTTRNSGTESGVTTTATGVVAWQRALVPGEVIFVNAKVSALQTNGAGFAVFDVEQGAHQLGASLNYNNQSANFTAGNSIAGATSGATATIQADSDSGSTGTLTLCNVNGTFVDGEIIAETNGTGSAHVNGAITINATALMGSLTTVASTLGGSASGWTATFDCNGNNMRHIVTGEANKTISWKVAITESPAQ